LLDRYGWNRFAVVLAHGALNLSLRI
jgi:hypothetical protein